jgi:transcriptional regulator with XRE-family HTH domain
MHTPWPALVRRLRFISNLKQADLADLLGVEQGTVSRWERAIYVPDIPVQRRIRDMLHRLEPAIPPDAIEAMPIRALLYCSQTMGLVCSVSEIVAREHGFSAHEMRYKNIAPMWPESVREMHERLDAMDAWRSGDVVLVRAKIFRINNEWCDTTAIPVAGSGLVLFTAGLSQTPPAIDTSQCELTIVTKDEMVA